MCLKCFRFITRVAQGHMHQLTAKKLAAELRYILHKICLCLIASYVALCYFWHVFQSLKASRRGFESSVRWCQACFCCLSISVTPRAAVRFHRSHEPQHKCGERGAYLYSWSQHQYHRMKFHITKLKRVFIVGLLEIHVFLVAHVQPAKRSYHRVCCHIFQVKGSQLS